MVISCLLYYLLYYGKVAKVYHSKLAVSERTWKLNFPKAAKLLLALTVVILAPFTVGRGYLHVGRLCRANIQNSEVINMYLFPKATFQFRFLTTWNIFDILAIERNKIIILKKIIPLFDKTARECLRSHRTYQWFAKILITHFNWGVNPRLIHCDSQTPDLIY